MSARVVSEPSGMVGRVRSEAERTEILRMEWRFARYRLDICFVTWQKGYEVR